MWTVSCRIKQSQGELLCVMWKLSVLSASAHEEHVTVTVHDENF